MPAPATLSVQQYVESICQPINNEREKIAPVGDEIEKLQVVLVKLWVSVVLIIH
jgi:hypothetical protein